jgi:hypothetical protein
LLQVFKKDSTSQGHKIGLKHVALNGGIKNACISLLLWFLVLSQAMEL